MHDTAISKKTAIQYISTCIVYIRMKTEREKKLVNRIILAIVFVLSVGKSMP